MTVIYSLEEVVENLKIEEGYSASVYECSMGHATIGYGRNISKTGLGITEDEAEVLLHNDVERTVAELERALPFFAGLDRRVGGVLIELAFQLGLPTLLKFSKTLGHIEHDEIPQAADELLQSRFAEQTPARANRLAERLRAAR